MVLWLHPTVIFWFPHAQHPREPPANVRQVPAWAFCQGWWWAGHSPGTASSECLSDDTALGGKGYTSQSPRPCWSGACLAASRWASGHLKTAIPSTHLQPSGTESIHPSTQYSLSTCYVPNTLLGTDNTADNKTKPPVLVELMSTCRVGGAHREWKCRAEK